MVEKSTDTWQLLPGHEKSNMEETPASAKTEVYDGDIGNVMHRDIETDKAGRHEELVYRCISQQDTDACRHCTNLDRKS